MLPNIPTTARRRTQGKAPRAAPRRGRPTADGVTAIDQAIRSAALASFLELGFEQASMDAIAIAARVSKSTLYVRFAGKEALFRSLVDEQLERLSARATALNHPLPADRRARMRGFARALVEVWDWEEYRIAMQLVTAATPAFPEIARRWNEVATQDYLRFLASELARDGDRLEERPIDWHLYASIFLHSIAGWHRSEGVRRRVGKTESSAYCDKVIDALLAAVAVDLARP